MILDYKGIDIHYSKIGKGEALVLLHGFLHSSTMWNEYTKLWINKYCVISIDLPGHGKSDIVKDVTINEMAKIVHKILQKEKIDIANFIGHSMGGYVGLAYFELFPKKINKLILLHSSAYEDTDLVKEKRDLSLKILDKHPAMFVRKTIEYLYSKENLIKYKAEIETSIEQAKNIGYEGYKEATIAMRDKKDRIHLLNVENSIFIIAGEYDKVIEKEVSISQIKLLKKGSGVILKNVAHMGFIEDDSKCLRTLNLFLFK